MKFVDRYWKGILIALTIFFAIGTFVMIFWHGKDEAKTFNDNILVELFIGGLMLFVPTITALWIGKRISKNLFYNDMENYITKIREQRLSGELSNNGARTLVKEAALIFGREVLEDPLMKRLPRSIDPILHEEKTCGVCDLEAQLTINNHCQNCKLDCFAWEKFIKAPE